MPAPSPSDAARERPVAIALMVAAVACFGVLDTMAKWLSLSLPPLEVAWVRYAGATLVTLVALDPVRNPGRLRSARPWAQVARGLMLLATTVANFFAIQRLQLAETVSITFAMPLLVALAAGPALGEWVGPRRLAAIGVGFLGVLVVARPGTGAFQPAVGFALCGVACYAAYALLTRALAGADDPRTTSFHSAFAGAVVLAPAMPFVWVAPPSMAAWAVLAATGLVGALGHYLLILAHARAPAPILAPFVYTQIVWMIGFGVLVFGDVPTTTTLAGASIVIGSGLYLWWRERVTRAPATSLLPDDGQGAPRR